MLDIFDETKDCSWEYEIQWWCLFKYASKINDFNRKWF